MKRIIFLMAAALSLVACNQNEPTRGDETQKNQPANPSTWSPVGHKYVSTDDSNYGRYLDYEITFVKKDSFLWHRDSQDKMKGYRLQYPLIYLEDDQTPWLKFVDTLTITKAYEMADESSKYELVY